VSRFQTVFHEVAARIATLQFLIIRLLLAGGPSRIMIVMVTGRISAGRRRRGRVIGGCGTAPTDRAANAQGESNGMEKCDESWTANHGCNLRSIAVSEPKRRTCGDSVRPRFYDAASRSFSKALQSYVKLGVPFSLSMALSLSPVVPGYCASSATRGEAAIGQVLPDAALEGLNGPSTTLRAFRGKPLLINVWASWCGPCQAEMASLERLAWQDPRRDFAIIGISTDDYPDRALALLRKSNATISHFIDRKLRMENMLGASRLPLTVLVDSGGRVIDKIYGSRQWDSAESQQLIFEAFKRH